MVDLEADQVCSRQYRRVLHSSHADGDRSRGGSLFPCCDHGDTDTGSLLYRARGVRFHDRHPADPADRKYHYDLTWDHRLLHSQDLRGDKRKTEIYRFKKGVTAAFVSDGSEMHNVSVKGAEPAAWPALLRRF